MHTFSCAVQSVDVDGTQVRFDADPGDYSNCRLYIGDNVLTFHRNGVLLSVAKVEPEPEPEPEDQAEPQTAAEVHREAVAHEEAEL